LEVVAGDGLCEVELLLLSEGYRNFLGKSFCKITCKFVVGSGIEPPWLLNRGTLVEGAVLDRAVRLRDA
jgi:hypothetical protein